MVRYLLFIEIEIKNYVNYLSISFFFFFTIILKIFQMIKNKLFFQL
jgi:hypothetical protein